MPTSSYGPYVYVPNSGGGQSRVCPEMVRAITVAFWLADLSHKLVYTQGGLNSSAVKASAATHNGLCVADLRTTNMTAAELWRVTESLLRCGVIAFIRGVQDSLTDHLHCVMADPRHAHPDAKAQVTEYRRGGDGLVGTRPFYGPKVAFTTWEDSPHYGTDAWDMAEPKDVWTADVDPAATKVPAGKVLWDIWQKVKTLGTAAGGGTPIDNARALLRWKAGTREVKDWTTGHLIDYTARASLAQGRVLAQIVTMLGQISEGQKITQADLDAVQAQLEALTKVEEEPEPPTEAQA
jgi:hypothetical protein